jgi:catechol 2,3-dioxygenase-like lactoylglutathione lyase family enzyme
VLPKIAPWAFVLAVPDLDKSTGYFRDVLGFRVRWEDATEWRLVERDGVRIMLGHCPSDMRPADLGSHAQRPRTSPMGCAKSSSRQWTATESSLDRN